MTQKEYKRRYYLKNKELILQKIKEYRNKNKELIQIRKKKYARSEVGKLIQKRSSLKYETNNRNLTGTRYRTPEQIYQRRFYSMQRNAKARNIEFNLSKNDVIKLMMSPCNYCGDNRLDNFGVDRIDSNIGYFIDNCVPCCKTCNTAKLDLSLDDFKSHVIKMYNHMVKDKV